MPQSDLPSLSTSVISGCTFFFSNIRRPTYLSYHSLHTRLSYLVVFFGVLFCLFCNVRLDLALLCVRLLRLEILEAGLGECLGERGRGP